LAARDPADRIGRAGGDAGGRTDLLGPAFGTSMTKLGPLTIGRTAGAIWLLALGWTVVVVWAGSDDFSAQETSRYLLPFLRWLLPDASPKTLWRILFFVRKSAHFVEYGLLALIVLGALLASTRAALLRLALLALAWVLVTATIDEGRQGFSSARTGSGWDVGRDVAGGILALAFAIAYTRVMRGRRRPAEPG
jgi:VanZ family protein